MGVFAKTLGRRGLGGDGALQAPPILKLFGAPPLIFQPHRLDLLHGASSSSQTSRCPNDRRSTEEGKPKSAPTRTREGLTANLSNNPPALPCAYHAKRDLPLPRYADSAYKLSRMTWNMCAASQVGRQAARHSHSRHYSLFCNIYNTSSCADSLSQRRNLTITRRVRPLLELQHMLRGEDTAARRDHSRVATSKIQRTLRSRVTKHQDSMDIIIPESPLQHIQRILQ